MHLRCFETFSSVALKALQVVVVVQGYKVRCSIFLACNVTIFFLVTLASTHNVLAYTKGLSVKLQGPYVDIVRAHHEITNVKETLKKALSNVR